MGSPDVHAIGLKRLRVTTPRLYFNSIAWTSRLDRLIAVARPFGERFKELGFAPKLTKQMKDQFDKRLGELTR
ncbi:MAG: hypothetical protein QM817_26925 [Archangium sp.]